VIFDATVDDRKRGGMLRRSGVCGYRRLGRVPKNLERFTISDGSGHLVPFLAYAPNGHKIPQIIYFKGRGSPCGEKGTLEPSCFSDFTAPRR